MTEATETESPRPLAHPLKRAEYPSVAVIIPCWNAEKWVARAIQSVLDQDYPNLEVIVIDDGSTDGSLDVIRSFGDRIRWETGPNRGACAARNRGLALTEAEYVMFLDADDYLADKAIFRLAERSCALGADGRIVVFGSVIRTGPVRKAATADHPTWISDGEIASKVWILLDGPRTTAPLHRRRYLQEVGGFEEGRPAGQEWDLHVRLMRNGVSFLHYDVPVCYYNQHNSPGRISNRPRSLHYWSDPLNVYQTLIAEGHQFTGNERKMLAYYLWGRGRVWARQGRSDCKLLFDLARQLDPGLRIGNFGYRLICSLSGPIWAERLAVAKTKLSNFVSSPVPTIHGSSDSDC